MKVQLRSSRLDRDRAPDEQHIHIFQHSNIYTRYAASHALALGVSHLCQLFAPSLPTADPIASPIQGSRSGGHDGV